MLRVRDDAAVLLPRDPDQLRHDLLERGHAEVLGPGSGRKDRVRDDLMEMIFDLVADEGRLLILEALEVEVDGAGDLGGSDVPPRVRNPGGVGRHAELLRMGRSAEQRPVRRAPASIILCAQAHADPCARLAEVSGPIGVQLGARERQGRLPSVAQHFTEPDNRA
ncbi:MAG: hypothetical protein P8170_17455 [Gemmatimonadota bacterium]